MSFTTLSHLTKSEIHLKKSPGAAMVVANDRSRRGASLVGAFVEHVIGAARAGADNAHGFSATLRSQTLIACWLLCLLIPWSFVRAPIWLNAIHSLPRTKPILNSLLLNTYASSLLKIDKICRFFMWFQYLGLTDITTLFNINSLCDLSLDTANVNKMILDWAPKSGQFVHRGDNSWVIYREETPKQSINSFISKSCSFNLWFDSFQWMTGPMNTQRIVLCIN